MTFRNLNEKHDWTFGTGQNNYVRDEQEIILNLETRILSFLGDCFFATDEGIDWWNLLDRNKLDKLEYAVQDVIIKTPGVNGINSVDAILGANRKLTLNYDIQTIFSQSYTGEIIPLTTAS
jgi:hypothetical protein